MGASCTLRHCRRGLTLNLATGARRCLYTTRRAGMGAVYTSRASTLQAAAQAVTEFAHLYYALF